MSLTLPKFQNQSSDSYGSDGFHASKSNSTPFPSSTLFVTPAFVHAKMVKKHVKIDDSSIATCSENPSRTLKDDTSVYRGVHIPEHMVSPGQDGYRTPTIEDYERRTGGPATPNGAQTPNGAATPDGYSTPNCVHNRIPHARHQLNENLSSTSLAHSILEKLHWRERIRHYTWTFFTMTMATGGIANVLHSGMAPSASFYSIDWQIPTVRNSALPAKQV